METAHITIIALGALLALCIGLLIRALLLVRLKNGAIDNYIRWNKERMRIKEELENVKREKRELEERLKRAKQIRGSPAKASRDAGNAAPKKRKPPSPKTNDP